MDEYKELAALIDSYRMKIVDFNRFENYYIYIDFDYLNETLQESLKTLDRIVKNELSKKFLKVYSDYFMVSLEIEPVFEDILFEIDKLKGLYKELEKYSNDTALQIYRAIIKKIVKDIEIFFIKLENLILKGGEGKLDLEINIACEAALLAKHLSKKSSFALENFLLGLGLGWFFFSDEE